MVGVIGENQAVIMRLRPVAAVLVAATFAAAPLVVAQDADRAQQVHARAVELEADGNHAAALALLWEAAGLAPRDADIQNRLGEALERIGALDAAVDAFRRALAERPAFRKAENNLILTLVKAGRGRKPSSGPARSSRRRPTIRTATSRLAWRNPSRTSRKRSRPSGRLLELEPRHTPGALQPRARAAAGDRLAEALGRAGTCARHRAASRRPTTRLGVIYWHQGDLDRAAAALRAAVDARCRATPMRTTRSARC